MRSDPKSKHANIPAPGTNPASYAEIIATLDAIDPKRYDKTRNYLDGATTWLSPYLTHGIINTHTVAERVLLKHSAKDCYRLLYELAWREYFHRTWMNLGDGIFADIHNAQDGVDSKRVPANIVGATTGINVLDDGLTALTETGWMHNHLRMWVAGITCNIGHTHWLEPARWLHYNLLDGDLASNTLSWQWIVGTFSHKKYIANQENVNKYSRTEQRGTWLDQSYDALAIVPTPDALSERLESVALPQSVPGQAVPDTVEGDVALRSLWNLNPSWQDADDSVQQVLFIERQHIDRWPMAAHRWAFVQHWVDELGLDIWLGSVEDLARLSQQGTNFSYEDYPACAHWPGSKTKRCFHFGVPERSYRSFSQFWKQVR